jgi:hypothetical protein
MSQKTGKFTILFADGSAAKTVEKDGIFIGRLKDGCEIFLDHRTVSRIHAGTSAIPATICQSHDCEYSDAKRPTLGPENDVLADGDTIQIDPFAILDDETRVIADGAAAGYGHDTAGQTCRYPFATTMPPARRSRIERRPSSLEKAFRDEKEDWDRICGQPKAHPGQGYVQLAADA